MSSDQRQGSPIQSNSFKGGCDNFLPWALVSYSHHYFVNWTHTLLASPWEPPLKSFPLNPCLHLTVGTPKKDFILIHALESRYAYVLCGDELALYSMIGFYREKLIVGRAIGLLETTVQTLEDTTLYQYGSQPLW